MDDATNDFGDPGPEPLPPVDVYDDYIEPEPQLPASNVIPLYENIVTGIEPEFPEVEDAAEAYRPRAIDPNKPPPPKPTVLAIHDLAYEVVDRLLSCGNKYVITGPQASGKSWLALAVACEFIADGKNIWWMDPDGMNENRVVERLRGTYSIQDTQMASHFFYAEARDHIPLKALSEGLRGWAEANPPALVVWDSWGPSLSALGLDGNSADDINVWWQACIEPIAAVSPDCIHIMLDHVPKNQTDLQVKGVYGSQRKLSAPDAALTMKASDESPGYFFINVAKDRDGSWQDWSRDGLNLSIGDDGYYLSLNRTADQINADEDEEHYRQAAVALHQLTSNGKGVSRKAWRSEMHCRRSDQTRIMEGLISMGVAVEAELRNGSMTYRWDKPYDPDSTPAEAPAPAPAEAPKPPVQEPEDEEFDFPF